MPFVPPPPLPASPNRSIMERITKAHAEHAVAVAARVSGLPLIMESHGSIGTRYHSWSIALAETHTRLTPIGGARDVYDWAHIIARVAERIKEPAA